MDSAEVRITNAPVINPATGVEAHASRWGWHTCSQETFQKLKKLHKIYWREVSRMANWHRWNRKDPKNRRRFSKTRDESGRVTGYTDLGPNPEPPKPQVFEVVGTMREGWKRPDHTYPNYLDDFGVRAAYGLARTPFDSVQAVPASGLNLCSGVDEGPQTLTEHVDRLVQFARARGAW